MEQEWVNVADTAVKIGLGAFITGTFTLIGMRISAKSENRKFLLDKKIKKIEQLTEDIELYLTACDLYLTKILRTSKLNNGVEKINLLQEVALKEEAEKLSSFFKNRNSAESKLRLIKENSAADTITCCAELFNELEHYIELNHKTPTYEKLLSKKEDFKKIKYKIYHETSNAYKRLNH